MDTKYSFGKKTDLSFEDAVKNARSALAENGFGVLTEIDVKATLKKKMDKDVPPYIILGACNPPFASQALEAEPSIGVLLPCNVVVRENEAGEVMIDMMDPNAVLDMVDKPGVAEVAGQVRALMEKALNAI